MQHHAARIAARAAPAIGRNDTKEDKTIYYRASSDAPENRESFIYRCNNVLT